MFWLAAKRRAGERSDLRLLAGETHEIAGRSVLERERGAVGAEHPPKLARRPDGTEVESDAPLLLPRRLVGLLLFLLLAATLILVLCHTTSLNGVYEKMTMVTVRHPE